MKDSPATPLGAPLVRVPEVLQRLGITRQTLERWTRQRPDFPKPIHLNARCVRWSSAAIEAWIASQEKQRPQMRAVAPEGVESSLQDGAKSTASGEVQHG